MSKNKRAADELPSAFESVSILQVKRKKELDERERELQAQKNAFDIEMAELGGDNAQPSDVLSLNVGGTKMAVLRRTLLLVPSSMLASKFSGRWDDSMEKDADGNIFIDQSFHLFEKMINYLRQRANDCFEEREILSPLFNDNEKGEFYSMVNYYGMTNGIYPMRIYNRSSNEIHVEIGKSPECFLVTSEEWCSFDLRPRGHCRAIKSFEVTALECQRIQMGWVDETISDVVDLGRNEIGVGVGDRHNSIGLDPSRSSIVIDGKLHRIDDLQLKKGTSIRSEDYGNRWYVDGQLVASNEVSESYSVLLLKEERVRINKYYIAPRIDLYAHPVISATGSFKVTSFFYDDAT
mmetsp:Transcript_47335/g.56932  ORF Transcript_47335/g.56932 Transcript_47335/m.56932 type:complete len:350 (+) Transcript_47335:103-1152(+)